MVSGKKRLLAARKQVQLRLPKAGKNPYPSKFYFRTTLNAKA